MRPTMMAFLVVLAFALTASGTAAQPSTGNRVTGCDPAECDPVRLNGGEIVRDGPVKVILFGHLTDLIQVGGLDTRTPVGEPDVNQGFSLPTVDAYVGEMPVAHFENNRFQFVTTKLPTPFDKEPDRLTRPSSLAYNFTLVGDTVWGFWYLSPDTMGGVDSDAGPGFGAMPGVGVSMRLETGRFPGHGTLLASGATGLGTDPAGPAGAVALVALPDGEWVYEFRVPMTIEEPRVVAEEGIVWEVVVYQVETEDAKATQSGWRVRTGDRFPPRLILSTEDAVNTTGLEAGRSGDDVVFRWRVAGLWGAQDLDVQNLRLSVTGPDGQPVDAPRIEAFQYPGERPGRMGSVEVVVRFPDAASELPDGTYRLDGTARNAQGTYELTVSEEVDLGAAGLLDHDEGPGSPVVAIAGLVAGAAAAGFVVWRRARR